MSFRNERFNKAMRSLDAMCEGCDISKWPVLSDGGAGAAKIVEEASRLLGSGRRPPRSDEARRLVYGPSRRIYEREEKLFEAEMRLVEAGKGHLIRVLLLIVENFYNREESIKVVSKATYFRHRAELIAFFCETQVHMDI